ncbi:MAG: hypothetical protein IPQ16_14030 [Geobacteraceae bacterium]|nr:hypothetical protein [Geobacteraceae bacterium]
MKTKSIGIFAVMLQTMITASALAAYTQVSDVISGGGQEVNSTNYVLIGTVGQPVAGDPVTIGSYTNQSGFWNIRTADRIAPASLIFTLPGTNTTLTIPITTLTATDAHGVTGFYISETPTPPDPWGAGWVPNNPGSVVSLGTGPRTFYVWARDEAGNLSNGAMATSDIISRFLTVAFAGSGGSTITSSPAGINCSNGSSTDCTALFDVNAPVTLTATPDWYAALYGWSGTDDAPGLSGIVSMGTDKSATATFGAASNARITTAPGIPYGKIGDAYTAATTGATIEAREILFTEDLTFNQASVIYNLYGGYGPGFSAPAATDYSDIKGALTVKNGTLKVRNIRVHP